MNKNKKNNMKKQDWLDYMSFLRREIGKENNKVANNTRLECIRNYNLNELYIDLSDVKNKLRRI